MSPARYLGLYGLTLAVFLAVDGVWLAVVARSFYREHLGGLMRTSPNLAVALLFYLLYVFGVLALVVLPAHEASSLARAVGYGALFGIVAYATYDLTNLATLEGWPVIVTAVDLVWGGVLTAIVAASGYFFARWLGA